MKNFLCYGVPMLSLLFIAGFPITSLIKNQIVEEALEVGAEKLIHDGAKLVGEEVDVSIDLNPSEHPKCKHCHIHCPK